jgi:hypothetical protein
VINNGTRKVKITRIPVRIRAINIRPLLTARVAKNAEIFLVLSKYIWAAPKPHIPIMTITEAGIPIPNAKPVFP